MASSQRSCLRISIHSSAKGLGAWIPRHCLNPLTTVRVVQIFDMILDAIILALPVSAVLHLQLSTTRKIGLVAVFLLGGL